MFNLSNWERKMPGTIIRVQEGHVILELVEIVRNIFLSCLRQFRDGSKCSICLLCQTERGNAWNNHRNAEKSGKLFWIVGDRPEYFSVLWETISKWKYFSKCHQLENIWRWVEIIFFNQHLTKNILKKGIFSKRLKILRRRNGIPGRKRINLANYSVTGN